jgi:sarcosine oxidase subunit gamma
VADLIARTPFDGLLPLRFGSVEATEIVFDAITSVAPFRGRGDETSDELENALGLPLPKPGRMTASGQARAVWSGMDQVFILGARPGRLPGAAVTDQTDAWAALALEGADARAVLARLVPVDLGPGAFAVGHAARTLLGHMACILMRLEEDRYAVLVFRSMAGSAAHELERAMRMVAARGAL